MAALRTYDPKKILVTFAGVRITGFAEDVFVSATPQADLFVSSVGTDGEVTRVAQNDPRHLVTITLAQSSPSNDYLSSKAAADAVTPNGGGVGTLQILDLIGTTILEGRAWVQRLPDVEFGRSVGTRAWALEMVASDTKIIGGNPVTS